MGERDRDRAAVYAAEDQFVATLERAGAGAAIEFFGSTLTIPAERKFADLDSVRRYLETVCALPAVTMRWPDVAVPSVRERRGPRQAHYCDGVIALPIGERWAGRESVVLHELAHHLVQAEAATAHDTVFVSAYVVLIEAAMGPEAALLMRASLDGAGVTVVSR